MSIYTFFNFYVFLPIMSKILNYKIISIFYFTLWKDTIKLGSIVKFLCHKFLTTTRCDICHITFDNKSWILLWSKVQNEIYDLKICYYMQISFFVDIIKHTKSFSTGHLIFVTRFYKLNKLTNDLKISIRL